MLFILVPNYKFFAEWEIYFIIKKILISVALNKHQPISKKVNEKYYLIKENSSGMTRWGFWITNNE